MKTFDEETLRKMAELAFSIYATAAQCEAEWSVHMPGSVTHDAFKSIEDEADKLRGMLGVDLIAEAMGEL